MERIHWTFGCLCAVILGCGDSGGDSASAASTGVGPTVPDPTTGTSAPPTPTTSDGTSAGSATDGGTTTSAATDTTGTAPQTSTSATTTPISATDADTTTTASTDTTTTGTTGAPDPDTGTTGCPDLGMGDVEFSYIWIANSPQGTVSKIDTQTLQEVGRYQVRPQGGGLPSRTSVNLHGDMVIGAREGGVTKIWARVDDCVESNGTPGIQTSTGKNDVLPWGQDECIAWYTDGSYLSQRAVAWTTGTLDPQSCTFKDPKVWIGATSDAVILHIMLLSGDTGAIEKTVDIPGTTGYMERSPYGGAVDAENDVWMVNGYCGGTLVQVHQDMTYETYPMPPAICPYGISVDSKGYVWIGGYQTFSGRYDPDNGTWDMIAAQGLGIQEDAENRVWLGAYGQNAVIEIDGETLQVVSTTPVPTTGQSKGIGIDFFGYVWIVSDAGTTAVRMDPDTKQIQTYDGLNDPYSYSDMTGFGLKNAVLPQ